MKRRSFSSQVLSLVATFLAVAVAATPAAAQKDRRDRNYPPRLEGARVEVYKTIGDAPLNIYIFAPPKKETAAANESAPRPAIVFFFGGGWRSGSPAQFHEHCKYLAGRGMVAMTADYRVSSRHGTKAVSCVADGKSAVRWMRTHAARLGIDPARIAAAGGSAGGHVAACTGLLTDHDEPGEEASVSSRPDALVLFNPALVLAPVDGAAPLGGGRAAGLRERMGVEPQALSPYHHVGAKAPPTIIFHGEADTTVPYRTAEQFTAAMRKAGNRCKLVGFEGATHGFFNHGRGDGTPYRDTVAAMDKFLVSLGWLEEAVASSQ